MNKVLITGGAGYLGSILTQHLLDNGKLPFRDVYRVDVIDNLMYKQTSLLHLCSDERFRFIQHDVTDFDLRDRIETQLSDSGIEFRRGLSGGGNQMRQPYFRNRDINFDEFPNIEHVHNFSWYIGNYPSLDMDKIKGLITLLNNQE